MKRRIYLFCTLYFLFIECYGINTRSAVFYEAEGTLNPNIEIYVSLFKEKLKSSSFKFFNFPDLKKFDTVPYFREEKFKDYPYDWIFPLIPSIEGGFAVFRIKAYQKSKSNYPLNLTTGIFTQDLENNDWEKNMFTRWAGRVIEEMQFISLGKNRLLPVYLFAPFGDSKTTTLVDWIPKYILNNICDNQNFCKNVSVILKERSKLQATPLNRIVGEIDSKKNQLYISVIKEKIPPATIHPKIDFEDPSHPLYKIIVDSINNKVKKIR